MRKRPVISLPKRAAPTTARGARSDCASVDGCAALRLRRARCGQAERAEGGETSGTLVSQILRAPQRETEKQRQIEGVLTP